MQGGGVTVGAVQQSDTMSAIQAAQLHLPASRDTQTDGQRDVRRIQRCASPYTTILGVGPLSGCPGERKLPVK